MSEPRFFVPEFLEGESVELPFEEAHHARKVLRLREGAGVELFDGKGCVAEGRVALLDRKQVCVDISACTHSAQIAPHIGIAFPPPKGKRMLAAIESLTELGVDEIIPLRTERSVAEGGDPEKWRARAIEAAKQCRRSHLPVFRELTELSALCGQLAAWDLVVIASLCDAERGADVFGDRIKSAGRALWCIGPEGGFTPEEEDALVKNGAMPVRLGPNILRIATAAELCVGLTRYLVGATF